MLFVELTAQGLVQGSLYALIALGLTLVYGLLRILHVAHAALFTLGAYVGVLVTNSTGSLLLAFVAAMLCAGVVGVVMYRLCYAPLLKQPPFVALMPPSACTSRLKRCFASCLARRVCPTKPRRCKLM